MGTQWRNSFGVGVSLTLAQGCQSSTPGFESNAFSVNAHCGNEIGHGEAERLLMPHGAS
jgi:hypothetical protein